jgi:hypothetical protein
MPFLRSHSRRESGATAIDANANTSTKATHPSRPPPNRTADSEAYDHRPSMERKTGLARYTDDLEAAALEFAGTVLFLVIALGGVQSLPVPATTTNAVEFMLRNLYVVALFPSVMMNVKLTIERLPLTDTLPVSSAYRCSSLHGSSSGLPVDYSTRMCPSLSSSPELSHPSDSCYTA